jgi:hypothetical protein
LLGARHSSAAHGLSAREHEKSGSGEPRSQQERFNLKRLRSTALFLVDEKKIIGAPPRVFLGFSLQDMSGTGVPRSRQARDGHWTGSLAVYFRENGHGHCP